MSFITYTALRELEKTGFLRTGVDLSAAPSDDSFNSVSTSLSGVTVDQWVNVAGFAAPTNNGYFQSVGSSTSTKITQVTPPVTHARLSGASSNFLSTPDSTLNSVTGPIQLIGLVSLVSMTGSSQVIVAKDDGASNRDYNLFVDTAGKLNFLYTTDGSTTAGRLAVSTVVVPFSANAQWYAKATYDTATGTVQFFTSSDGVLYTQLGTDVAITAGAIHNGTGALTAGANGAGANSLNGRLYFVEVYNGIAGTLAATFIASRGTRGASTVGSPTGETWTLNTSGTPPSVLQGAALSTEAAGPSVTFTGYKRGPGQLYSLEFGSEAADKSRKVDRTIQTPMNRGAPEVSYWGTDKMISVRTGKIDETLVPQWEEFLASVEGGELFTFDRYGTVASPVEPVQVMLQSESHQWMREGSVYPSRYNLSFEVLILG